MRGQAKEEKQIQQLREVAEKYTPVLQAKPRVLGAAALQPKTEEDEDDEEEDTRGRGERSGGKKRKKKPMRLRDRVRERGQQQATGRRCVGQPRGG